MMIKVDYLLDIIADEHEINATEADLRDANERIDDFPENDQH